MTLQTILIRPLAEYDLPKLWPLLDGMGNYESLGLIGDPCPDPEHPFFEITF